MPEVWTNLARQHGKRAVVSISITDAELDAETARQTAELFPLIASHLPVKPGLALDFGCGAGRFTKSLADLTVHGATGFDPCAEYLAMAPRSKDVQYVSANSATFFSVFEGLFDLVFAFCVLGDPNLALTETIDGLAHILAPGGAILIVDHMETVDQNKRWWRFRPFDTYAADFGAVGIYLEKIGTVMQIADRMTVAIGRRRV